MTDRELLELAAKAAGYDPKWREWVTSRIAEFQTIKHKKNQGFFVNDKQWNPLDDDGDALRLAANIGMNLYMSSGFCIAEVISDGDCQSITAKEKWTGDTSVHFSQRRSDATRRAIVRAAAEIGKAMP